MVKTIALALALLVGCAPAYRVATKKCPPTTMLLSDFFIATGALAVSAIKYNAGKTAESLGYTVAGATIYIGANLAETTCRK